MQLNTFPDCCGAKLISGFWGEEDLTKKKLTYVVAMAGHASHLMACLIRSQEKVHGPTLEELGFQRVSSGFNGNSGNTVALFVKTRPEDRDSEEYSKLQALRDKVLVPSTAADVVENLAFSTEFGFGSSQFYNLTEPQLKAYEKLHGDRSPGHIIEDYEIIDEEDGWDDDEDYWDDDDEY